MNGPDLERPYIEQGKREEEFNAAKEEAAENFWYEISDKKFAEKLVYDYEPEVLPELLHQIGQYHVELSRIGNAVDVQLGIEKRTPEQMQEARHKLRYETMRKLMGTIETAFDSYIEGEAQERVENPPVKGDW